MATQVMPETLPTTTKSTVRPVAEPSVRNIIERARSAPASGRGAWWLSGLTALLMWASFAPLDWGPLGWICLVPLILLVRLESRPRWLYTAVFAGGFASIVALLQWMRLGDPTMYFAWIALAAYMALYFPAFVALSRVGVHRFSLPLTLTVPVVWTGLEFLRANLMTGFAWYFLSHTQYRWIELIQISDVVGAYGVSFLMTMTAACLAGLVPSTIYTRLKLLPVGENGFKTPSPLPLSQRERGLNAEPSIAKRQVGSVAVCLTLFAAVLTYGYVRRAQADFQEGPRVALIQGNFTASVKHNPAEAPEIFERHHQLTGRAVPHQPDLIVWPETMYRYPLLVADPNQSDDELRRIAPQVPPSVWRNTVALKGLTDMSRQAGAAMIVGVDAYVADPQGLKHYNSAALSLPDVGFVGRYDKLHRVPFGEFIPLKREIPWLYKFTPFPPDYGIDAGQTAAVFSYKQWRFAPVICFEDTVPHLVRRIVKSTTDPANGHKPVDCLVNLTNDGWFHGSSELEQHLITAVFRSVECRTPMVRAVNTGISAVIDGDGVIVEPDVFIDGDNEGRESMRDPKTGRWHKQINAAVIDTVPLDDRTSLYVAWGDWFAGTCCFLAGVLMFGGFWRPNSD